MYLDPKTSPKYGLRDRWQTAIVHVGKFFCARTGSDMRFHFRNTSIDLYASSDSYVNYDHILPSIAIILYEDLRDRFN